MGRYVDRGTYDHALRRAWRAEKRVRKLEVATRRAVDVIGGVWNGSIETLDESRAAARDVYHELWALLDTGEETP